MLSWRNYGFSLIELMIGLAIIAIALMLGLPSYQAWIQNSRVRNTAESILNGMQLARAEAIRRNVSVGFYLLNALDSTCDDDATKSNWVVSVQDPQALCNVGPSETVTPRIIQMRPEQEGASDAIQLATLPAGKASIVFTSLGRPNNPGNDITQIDVQAVSAVAGARNLRITVGAGGNVRLCDPNLSGADPRKC